MNANVSEPRVKVWRPQGFAGLEVDKFENIPNLHIPVYPLNGYEFTVARGAKATIHYMKSS